MIVITGGQSFADVAKLLTIGGSAYGPAIAVQNNMDGQEIAGKKFYLTIPDEWMADTSNAGKTVTLPDVIGSSSGFATNKWLWVAGGIALLAVLTS
jgi:hypothetical protein